MNLLRILSGSEISQFLITSGKHQSLQDCPVVLLAETSAEPIAVIGDGLGYRRKKEGGKKEKNPGVQKMKKKRL